MARPTISRPVRGPFASVALLLLALLPLLVGSKGAVAQQVDSQAATAATAAAAGGGGGGEVSVSLDDYCREAEAIDALSDEVLAVATSASLQAAVSEALLRGWFDLCRNLILRGRERKVDFTTVVYQAKSHINAQLKAMANAIRGQAVPTVSPAFEWAQSHDEVAINVKLAHKLDTPATLDCQSTEQMVVFGNGTNTGAAAASSSYTFRAECPKSAKNFLLQLKLWALVQPEGSTWEYGSVGRVSLRLRKAEPGRTWPKLLDDKVNRPSNMHTWYEMQARFDEERKKRNEAANAAAGAATVAAASAAAKNDTATANASSSGDGGGGGGGNEADSSAGNSGTGNSSMAPTAASGAAGDADDADNDDDDDDNNNNAAEAPGNNNKAVGARCKKANECAAGLVCRDDDASGDDGHVLVDKQTCLGFCKCVADHEAAQPETAQQQQQVQIPAADAASADAAAPQDEL
jgi:hypothetical protein